MKIYAFTDIHNRKPVLTQIEKNIKKLKPDLLIDCGDISWFGKGLNSNSKVLNQLNIPLLILHGNHETIEDMKKIEKKYKNIIFLHNKSYSINNYVFYGYGGHGFDKYDRALEKVIPKIKKTLKKKDKLIFITHMPIHGTTTDYIPNYGHVGSKSALKLVKQLKPDLVLSGHIHETEKKQDKIGKTLIVNPGRGMLFKI